MSFLCFLFLVLFFVLFFLKNIYQVFVLVVHLASPANILILHPLYAGRCNFEVIHIFKTNEHYNELT